MGGYYSKNTEKKYGWKRNKTNHGKKIFNGFKSELPEKCDLRDIKLMPDVYDQGKLGSCTANSLAFLYQYDEIKQHNTSNLTPSRLFIYYNERKIENHINDDIGASLDDGIKSICDNGICDENLWKYDITKFAIEPTTECYEEGKKCRALNTNIVQKSIQDIKTAINDGFPIGFGFTVYESFESQQVAQTGMMPNPNMETEKVLGGHAVAIVGYDDTKKTLEGDLGMLIVRNSWSNKWGDNGYFYMPYKFAISANTDDYVIVYSVTDTI